MDDKVIFDEEIFEQLQREIDQLELDHANDPDMGMFFPCDITYLSMSKEYLSDPCIHLYCERCKQCEVIHRSQEKTWKCICYKDFPVGDDVR